MRTFDIRLVAIAGMILACQQASFAQTSEQSLNGSNFPAFNSSPDCGFSTNAQPGFNSAPAPGYTQNIQPGFNYAPASGYTQNIQPGFNYAPAPGYTQNIQPGFNSAPASNWSPMAQPAYNSSPAPGYGINNAYPSGQFSSQSNGMQASPQLSLGRVLNQVIQNMKQPANPAYQSQGSQSGQNMLMQNGAASQGFPLSMKATSSLEGMKTPLQSGASPFSPQNLLRIFMGGSPGYPGGSGNSNDSPEKQAADANITGQAEALCQRARDQASQAESDAERAAAGGDRLSAASSAQYHANDAREAADTASSITYNGPQYAKDHASQARDAANRAQAAADRAHYNAGQ